MKVLLTGAHGFIGRHVMAFLEENEIEAVPLDLTHGADVCSFAQVAALSAGCTHVIHLAGILGTSELFKRAHEAVNINIHGTLNVLQVCEDRGMSYTGITMPEVWDNVYQATKRCGRNLASAWNRHRGVPVSHVRAFNAYGVGQKVLGVQKIIPTFSFRAWRNQPIPIWGDGTQLVDLVWAGDLAEMLVRATSFGDDEVFDGGYGVGVSVNDVAAMVVDTADSDSPVEHLLMRDGEHEAKCVATGEGWDLLGFDPSRLDRAAKLEETINSYRPADS